MQMGRGPFPSSFLLPECPSCSILNLTCANSALALKGGGKVKEGLLGLPFVIAGVTGAQTLARTLLTNDLPPCRAT